MSYAKVIVCDVCNKQVEVAYKVPGQNRHECVKCADLSDDKWKGRGRAKPTLAEYLEEKYG